MMDGVRLDLRPAITLGDVCSSIGLQKLLAPRLDLGGDAKFSEDAVAARYIFEGCEFRRVYPPAGFELVSNPAYRDAGEVEIHFHPGAFR